MVVRDLFENPVGAMDALQSKSPHPTHNLTFFQRVAEPWLPLLSTRIIKFNCLIPGMGQWALVLRVWGILLRILLMSKNKDSPECTQEKRRRSLVYENQRRKHKICGPEPNTARYHWDEDGETQSHQK